ncbi:hypothetical protein [Halalkalirubrum salinum]|uniref:hypothetical protein n=1 Tax=Halalkalirubrum salinum TaxID=2563889 RepID=UPI0010FB84B7|nr:hypothetical protein [Halalkalirubrum salinum]
MSTADKDSGPGQREVAHRLFAAEFDDTTLSYSESDEERAPNYVVTPTGARVNRLFVAGVLTEVERVNNETLRGRVVDPTGAFVTYAGQYQPGEQTFLDTASPPAFVSLTGKARTFEPEDSDMVYTSVRPESLAVVDAETRDRAIVTAAKSTLDRLAVFKRALESDLRGDALETALLAGEAPQSLAAGIPRAIEHYGTTQAYVEALRQLAVDALAVVTGDREEVGRLNVSVDDPAPTSIGPLPSTDVTIDDQAVDNSVATETEPVPAGADTADTADIANAADTVDAADTTDSDALPEFESTAASERETSAESASSAEPTESPSETGSTAPASTAESTESASTADPTESASTAESPDPSDAAESIGSAASTDAPSPMESSSSTGSAVDSPESAVDPAESVSTPDESTSANETVNADSTGSETLETDTEPPEADADTSPAGSVDEPEPEPEADFDPTDIDGMYEMDDEEREAVESEFGTEFSTGSEVDPAGEADIDVPDADEFEAESSAASETDSSSGLGDFQDTIADDSASEAEPDVGSEPSEAASDSGADDSGTDLDGESADVSADVNLEDAAIELMDELDDGDGVARSTVTAQIAETHGVEQQAVDDAIEEALLSGRCYEPTDGILKSI